MKTFLLLVAGLIFLQTAFALQVGNGGCLNVSDLVCFGVGQYTSIQDTLLWLHSQLPDNEFLVYPVEACDVDGICTLKQWPTPWKTKVDHALNAVYYRKDVASCSFYGEVWRFNQSNIWLRAESLSQEEQNQRIYYSSDALGKLPWSTGRYYLPLTLDPGLGFYPSRSIYRNCTSNAEFDEDACNQEAHDTIVEEVNFEIMKPFSTAMDGMSEEIASSGWRPTKEMTSFSEALVLTLNFFWAGSWGRERFFFGRRGELNYGIVRWDSSVPLVPGTDGRKTGWRINMRAFSVERCNVSGGTETGNGYAHCPNGLTLSWNGFSCMECAINNSCPPIAGQWVDMTFNGFANRVLADTFPFSAGLRIEQTRAPWPADLRNTCPPGTFLTGAFVVDEAPGGPAEINGYDADGTNASVSTMWLCSRGNPNRVALLKNGTSCPASRFRGAIWAYHFVAMTSFTNTAFTGTDNAEVQTKLVLCRMDDTGFDAKLAYQPAQHPYHWAGGAYCKHSTMAAGPDDPGSTSWVELQATQELVLPG